MSGRILIVLLICGICGLFNGAAIASDPPVVGFDAKYTRACHAVATEQEVATGNKIIEVPIPLSAILKTGKTGDLDSLTIRLNFGLHTDGIEVVDYAPRTTLYTELAEPILVVVKHRTTVGGEATVTTAYESIAGKGTANAQASTESETVYKQLPTRQVLKVSGTEDRSTTVVFKLNGSQYSTLEGEQSFTCLVSVPKAWSAGCVTVRCEADGFERGVLSHFDKRIKCGRAEFAVGLYLAGDVAAEKVAKDFADAQQSYLDELAKPRPSSAWGRVWDFLADYWFISKLGGGLGATATNFGVLDAMRHGEKPALPADVLDKLTKMHQARERLEGFSR